MSWQLPVIQELLLVFSALFSIVNPPGSALIFSEVTRGRSHAERQMLAKQIGFYAAIVMLTSIWIGVYVLKFFGVSMEALRLAGGLYVAATGWHLLSTADQPKDKKDAEDGDAFGTSGIAFFPLTMPLTTGPGTIAVAIALGANHPDSRLELVRFIVSSSTAVLLIALLVWLCYRSADRVIAFLGTAGARTMNRLAAFLLLCIGVEIALNGVYGAVVLIKG